MVAWQFVNGFVAACVKIRDWRIYTVWDVFIGADGITLFTKSSRRIRKWSGGLKSLLNRTTTYCQTCWQLWTFLNTGPAFFHSYLGLGSRKTEHKCSIQTDKSVRLMVAAAAAHLPEASNSCRCTHSIFFLAKCLKMQTQTHTNIPKHPDNVPCVGHDMARILHVIKAALQITDGSNYYRFTSLNSVSPPSPPSLLLLLMMEEVREWERESWRGKVTRHCALS